MAPPYCVDALRYELCPAVIFEQGYFNLLERATQLLHAWGPCFRKLGSFFSKLGSIFGGFGRRCDIEVISVNYNYNKVWDKQEMWALRQFHGWLTEPNCVAQLCKHYAGIPIITLRNKWMLQVDILRWRFFQQFPLLAHTADTIRSDNMSWYHVSLHLLNVSWIFTLF